MASASCLVYFRNTAALPSDGDPVEWIATNGVDEYDVTLAVPCAEPGFDGQQLQVNARASATISCDTASVVASGRQLYLISDSGDPVVDSQVVVFIPPT